MCVLAVVIIVIVVLVVSVPPVCVFVVSVYAGMEVIGLKSQIVSIRLFNFFDLIVFIAFTF
jgi:hypothetical protein